MRMPQKNCTDLIRVRLEGGDEGLLRDVDLAELVPLSSGQGCDIDDGVVFWSTDKPGW